ncbi:MAG: hypothetical protein ACLT2W_00120 [Intestinibacter bartlettii]|uniref:hypothetical protein n=1 Tax=Intestinibacter bartlettii TaxID=261299 RepID=UPI0039954853
MTGKIKRRSLRCGGRPKADFGSLFTSVIAPALNAAGSIADESIDNNKTITNGIVNNNTTIPSDPTKTPTMRLGGRKKCWIGAAIGAATSIAGSLFGNSAQKREMRRQQSIRDWQDATQEAANMTSVLNNSRDYQEDYLRQFRTAARLGKTLGAKGIYITDGGNATKIGNNTYLLRGGSHEDVNETGQTGIGINVGGNEVEAEGGEVAQKKNGALRIFSAQPILGNGMSPAQAILRGYNKDSVFSQQQTFKKRNGLKDDGSAKYGFGGDIKSIWNFIRSNRSPIDNIAALATAYQKLNPNSNYNKQKGKFKGGTFRGAGAGGTWTNDYKSNKGFDNFNDAYDDAVEHNAKTFIFGNKRYNTLKENNPIREINNRAVGSWRDSVVTKDRTGYGKDFGPIKGGASLIPIITETYTPKRIKHKLGGGLTSKNRGSSKHPYPSVSSKDFAGGGRNYPIPTKADAVDALRLAGLHGRSDVRSKVYSRYPELRKKAEYGVNIDPYRNYSTTYKNKTSRGNKLSIRNGVVFLNNKRAPKGYKWFDKGNSTTYLVGNDGRFSIYQIHGKKPLERIDFNDDNYVAEANSRLELSNDSPNLPLYKADAQVWKDVLAKDKLERKHTLGGCSRPVKGMRPKALGGMYIPFNKRYTSIYDAPDYDSDYNGGNVLGNGEVTVTAKRIKPTFMKPNNDAMNIINHPANETPYIPQRHNRSRTIFSSGDYLGLGIDTLAALSTGLVNYNTAGKYTLPDRAPIIQASKLPTTYNVNPEIEEVKRYRDRLTGQTFNNTSSSVAALNRSGAINLDALSNLSKLWATKEHEENKMLTEDAKNQQTVAVQNVQNELARQSEIARIKNEAIQAKGDALNVGLSGLSQAWTNFWTAGRTAYEDDQARRAMIASSKEATPTRLSEMDFDLSPDILASLYRTAKDDRTKHFYLSRLSPKQRQKYGIN